MLLAGIVLMYAADTSPRNARRGTDCENKCNIAYSRAIAKCNALYGSGGSTPDEQKLYECRSNAREALDLCLENCLE